MDHLGNIPHPVHFSGLFQEHFPSHASGGLGLGGAEPAKAVACGAVPHHLAGGIVFLDGNLAVQGQVPADIGDAKTTLAQNGAHHILAV